ncbi:hypothetical protein LMG29542_08517 [Paraburkholderia humisilvae]|uniref:Integrase catalytic domain-containing protein n=1 Tax=Paraburkholderia humisilvae TaxID=627669 RepID=A0A6J5FD30_9BURK|nr:hypothetical protein LMG29542_08517 [Paraburkholderia humisilvae]
MSANRARWPIVTMARLLGVSASGFYAWRLREPSQRSRSDAQLLARIGTMHASARHVWRTAHPCATRARRRACGTQAGGAPDAHRGSAGRHPRALASHNTATRGARRAPDLVRRHFCADMANVLWVADATYVPADAEFLYLAVVPDVFSRRIIGRAMSGHLLPN